MSCMDANMLYNEWSISILSIITLRTCARGKAICLCVYTCICVFVSTKIARSGDIARCKYHYRYIREGGKTYLLQSSRSLKRATSAVNCVLLSVTPFHHTQLCHVLPQSRMLELNINVRVVKFVN